VQPDYSHFADDYFKITENSDYRSADFHDSIEDNYCDCRQLWVTDTNPNLFNNFPNLWLKAHVQHTIGLIKNQVRRAVQVGFASFQKIDQPSWCGYADFGTLTQHIYSKLEEAAIIWHVHIALLSCEFFVCPMLCVCNARHWIKYKNHPHPCACTSIHPWARWWLLHFVMPVIIKYFFMFTASDK